MAIALEELLVVCGTIITVGTAVGIVWKVARPLADLFSRMEELERRDRLDYERSKEMAETVTKMERQQRMMLSATSTICMHLRDGNNKGELAAIAKAMQDELIRA